jgi:hypothetical protein
MTVLKRVCVFNNMVERLHRKLKEGHSKLHVFSLPIKTTASISQLLQTGEDFIKHTTMDLLVHSTLMHLFSKILSEIT